MNILAWDIGGANIKVTLLKIEENHARTFQTNIVHFPVWKMGRTRLKQGLEKVAEGFLDHHIDSVGVTMTAELSDIYSTKREGVNHILGSIEEFIPISEIRVLSVDGTLIEIDKAKEDSLKVAGANWVATGWICSKLFQDCIVVDVGSTTTDIIPVMNHRIVSKGRADFERLGVGEVLYTGALRTNLATIVGTVPLRGVWTHVSSELFATSGDVYLVLGKISEEVFSTETADGRGRSRSDCLARISRIVCADIEILNEYEVEMIAKYIYDVQVSQISQSIRQVTSRLQYSSEKMIPLVVCGVGSFLAREAGTRIGFQKILDLEELIGREGSISTPTYALALMVAEREGVRIEDWLSSSR